MPGSYHISARSLRESYQILSRFLPELYRPVMTLFRMGSYQSPVRPLQDTYQSHARFSPDACQIPTILLGDACQVPTKSPKETLKLAAITSPAYYRILIRLLSDPLDSNSLALSH